MALRYIVQEEDEFNAATPNDDMTQYGELVEKRPLLEPYNKHPMASCLYWKTYL